MNSAAYLGRLAHARHFPKKNSFTYSVFMLYLDLDELPALDQRLRLFGLNRGALFSFHDRDHFKFIKQAADQTARTIAQENIKFTPEKYQGLTTRERIAVLLQEAGLEFPLGRVQVLTNPRMFGYVFNPVSFYYCFDEAGTLQAMLSEVNNTHGDQKMYVCRIDDPKQKWHTAEQQKNFYISPFMDFDNQLSWKFDEPGERTMVIIDTTKEGELELRATFVGERHEVTDRLLFQLLFRYPLMTLMIIFRIHYQALKLFLMKICFRDKAKEDQRIARAIKK
jgi:DUF1365 family protein